MLHFTIDWFLQLLSATEYMHNIDFGERDGKTFRGKQTN